MAFELLRIPLPLTEGTKVYFGPIASPQIRTKCILRVLSENQIWVERGSSEAKEGTQKCFKNYHISPIKLKTRVFRGLDSREITREKNH